MPSSTLRLSDVARHLAVPDGIVSTGWPSVSAKLAQLGIRFDPWQEQAARVALAKTSEGLYAAAVGGVVWSIPRQVGKTFTVGGLLTALALLQSGSLALWTAHQVKTAGETFRAMQAMCRREQVRPYVAKVRQANGDQGIEFVNGSRILFGAREQGFGLGFAGVDALMFDEAQRLGQKSLDDMVPATNSARNPLLFFIGTPPRPTDPGEVFKTYRAEALAGVCRDRFYLEFGADEACDPRKWEPGHVDWEQVRLANPSYPQRTGRAAVLRMMRLLGAESFRREGLGLWDSDGPGIPPLVDGSQWESLKATAPVDPGLTCYGVKISSDGELVALAVAARQGGGDAGGPVHVEVIEERPVSAGLGWLIDWLVPRADACAQIVVDGRAGAGVLVGSLRSAGVGSRTVFTPSVGQVIDAHVLMLDLIVSARLTHAGQPGLDAEIGRAVKRDIGVQGGWGWGSLDGAPVVGLEAATLAAWAAMTTRRYDDDGNEGGDRLL